MMSLDESVYSPPFVLCRKRPEAETIADGDTVAVDPPALTSTWRLCKGKKPRIIERPYITCRALFISGEIDEAVPKLQLLEQLYSFRHENITRQNGTLAQP
jgi:hypothetical protein